MSVIPQSTRRKLPLHEIFVSQGLKSGRTLLEIKKKGWTFKTQFTHVLTHFELRVQNKIKFYTN